LYTPLTSSSVLLYASNIVGLMHVMRCEVSERATHRSSPHGPCEPSTRVTGRARTYTTDLPKWDSTLPEAASERDHRSPHIRIVSPPFRLAPAPSSHGYDLYATTYDATFCIQRTGAPADCVRRYLATTNTCTFPRFRSRTLSHTGQTYRVLDADPLDEAEDIPTQPFPHFT
jgi:hypothetical protein